MFVKELFETYWTEEHLSPEEVAAIVKKHEDRLRAAWSQTHRMGIDERQLQTAAKMAAEKEIRDLVYKRAQEKKWERPVSTDLPPENLKPGERFSQWKIGPGGWGGD